MKKIGTILSEIEVILEDHKQTLSDITHVLKEIDDRPKQNIFIKLLRKIWK